MTCGRLVISTFVVLGVLALATRAPAAPSDRRVSNASLGVGIEAPPGWTVSRHAGYAETLAVLLHPDRSRISVTVLATKAETPAALFDGNRPGLVAQGLTVVATSRGPRDSLLVDLAPPPKRNEQVRQVYFVRSVGADRQALILTLVCPKSAWPQHTADLDFVMSRLTLDAPAVSQPRRAGDSASRSAGQSAKQLDGGETSSK
jgi:hypothetical protein